jgi:biotin carboxyl carrier protein
VTAVKAPLPGTVKDIKVSVGQAVKKGETVIILEAMKMEIPMVSPVDGTIASVDCAVGDAVEAGALLATVD